MTPRPLPEFTPGQLQAWTRGIWDAAPATSVRGVIQDTRILKPGALYAALRGPVRDGHEFVREAQAAGAVAALVANDWPRPDGFDLPLLRVPDTLKGLQDLARGWRDECRDTCFIGITGSVGKTTTRCLLQALLGGLGPAGGTIGNLNNHIGLPLSLLAMPPGMKHAVFEIGMNHPGELQPLCDILRPRAALLTNIGPVHIEFFDSIQGIAEEKATLLRALPEDGFAVLDAASPFFEYFKTQLKAGLVTACLNPAKNPAAAELKPDVMGASKPPNLLKIRGIPEPLACPLPGRHGAFNLLLAATLAHRLGLPWDAMNDALKSFQLPEMRGQSLKLRGRLIINDAYNANPVSVRAALESFAQQTASAPGRRVIILGDMRELGRESERLHRELGCDLAQGACGSFDVLATVGHAAEWIADAYKKAGGAAQTLSFHETFSAAKDILDWTREGDSILLKGSRGIALERLLEAFE